MFLRGLVATMAPLHQISADWPTFIFLSRVLPSDSQPDIGSQPQSDPQKHDGVAGGESVVKIDALQRVQLQQWARSRTASARVVLRSRIVLLAATGRSPSSIAHQLGTTVNTVKLWRRRFDERGIQGIANEASGRGRKPKIPADTVRGVQTSLMNGMSVRGIARQFGISPSTVVRIGKRYR
jgi:transposase